jgi:hypothetical protein
MGPASVSKNPKRGSKSCIARHVPFKKIAANNIAVTPIYANICQYSASWQPPILDRYLALWLPISDIDRRSHLFIINHGGPTRGPYC